MTSIILIIHLRWKRVNYFTASCICRCQLFMNEEMCLNITWFYSVRCVHSAASCIYLNIKNISGRMWCAGYWLVNIYMVASWTLQLNKGSNNFEMEIIFYNRLFTWTWSGKSYLRWFFLDLGFGFIFSPNITIG